MDTKVTDNLFSYSQSADKVFIYWQNRLVTTLKDKKAVKFLDQIENLDHNNGQLLMARITGNFKRGNEKAGN